MGTLHVQVVDSAGTVLVDEDLVLETVHEQSLRHMEATIAALDAGRDVTMTMTEDGKPDLVWIMGADNQDFITAYSPAQRQVFEELGFHEGANVYGPDDIDMDHLDPRHRVDQERKEQRERGLGEDGASSIDPLAALQVMFGGQVVDLTPRTGKHRPMCQALALGEECCSCDRRG